ncbi:MAG TPA: hypothetical protein VGJ56_09285 [Reyranella sp.]|jgi:hypothetical protein
MFLIKSKSFTDYLNKNPETGMGYWIVTAHLKDGRVYRQVLIEGGYVTRVRGEVGVPFSEEDVDHFAITHAKWKE